jgi:hypothetical protein
MKKILLSLLMLLILGISGFAQSTDTVTIGTGTTSDYTAPFNNYYKNSWTQIIYPASQINVGGYITSISFQVAAVPSSDYPFSTLTIYMGISQDSVNTTSSWLSMSELIEVYSATNVPSPTATGWQTFNLTTPFPYDGSGHLVIVTSKTMANYTTALKYNYTSTSNSVLYRRNDSDASYAQHPGTATGTLSANRPNLKLTIDVSDDFCYSVSNLAVSNITSTDASLSWNASNSNNVGYILQYKTASQSWDNATSVDLNDTTYDLIGILTANTEYNVRVATDCGNDTSAWKSITFKTPCVAFSVTDEPYIEGFEGYPSYSFPDCWTRLAGYSTTTYDYPYISNSTTAHSGGGYFYLYNTSASPIIVALPDFVEDINTLRLNFWMKPVGTTDAYGRVEVGVMSDLTNPSSFVLVKSWTAVGIGSTNWDEYTVDFDTVTPGTSDHIVIRRYVNSTTTYAWYMDDIKVMPIPSCEAPTALDYVDATTSSVDLTWDPGEESLFTVYYRPATDSVFEAVSNVSLDGDSIYSLSNLEPGTTYVWYVASVCSDGSETPSNPSTFSTTMVPETLPYTSDFGDESDQNWLLSNGSCTNYWTMGAINDTASALFITNDGTTPAYSNSVSIVSASKLFTVGDDAQFQISFDVNIGGESFYDYIKLFFAPATETYPASNTTPSSTDWIWYTYSQYAFDFSDYASSSTYTSATTYPYRYNLTGGNVVHIDAIMPNPNTNPDANSTAQVVFAWRNDGSGGTQPGAIIYNVTITPVTCPSPENLTVAAVSAHGADISWDENNTVTAWTVEYGEHGFSLGSGIEIPVSGTPEATLSNLNASTSYDVYVHSNCSDGSESINAFTTFTTPCEPLTTLPFSENFDSISGSTTTTVSVNNLPYCWSHYNHGTSSTYSGYPMVYASATYAASGTNSMRFYTYITSGTYDDQIAILPAFDPTLYPVNTLQLNFDARALSTSYTFELVVGVMSNPSDKNSFVPVDTLHLTSTSYQTFEVPMSQYTGNGLYIALMATQPQTGYNYGYVDNIVVDLIPSCPKPTHFMATTLSNNSVDLSWTEVGSATAWEIEYGPAGFTLGNGTVEPVTSEPPYSITGLTANTAYDFYIRANCGSEYSAYAPVLSLQTACDPIDSLPFADGFDTYGTGESAYPDCWGKINTYSSNRPYISTTNFQGVGSLYFYAGTSGTYNIAVTPLFDASIPVNTLQATFMYKGSGSNDRLIVGVMTNPADASTFEPIDTIVPASTASSWVEKEVIFSQYTGNGQYIAFKNAYTSTAGYAYLDNLVIDLIPTCPKPSQLHAVTTTTTSITLGWTEYGDATSWEIEYGPTGFTPGNGTVEMVSDNPYTITNLSASFVYDFYVTSDCGGEMSAHSSVLSASTSCGAIDQLPYTNNFDVYGTGTTAYPTCWSKINTYTSDRPYCNSSNAYEGAASLYFYSTSGTYNIAITPQFDVLIPINTLQASFMYRATNATDYMLVGVMTNPYDANTFVTVDTIHPSNIAATWVEREVNFSSYTGNGQYIAFYNGKPSATCYSYIDNLVINLIPDCPKPNQLHVVSTSTNSIEIGWTENGTATSWEIEYGPTGFIPGNGDVETATSNPYTISNLNSATAYDFYVSAICDGGGMSTQSFSLTAVTECEPLTTLPFTENFDSVSGYTTTTGSVNNLPYCWSYNNHGTTSSYSGYPIVYTSATYAASGSNSMRFYTYTTSGSYDDQIAILPVIDPNVYPVNTLQLSFDARNNSTYTFKVVVGIMSNPTDKTTFVPVDSITTTSNTYANYEFPLSTYTGTGHYIAIKVPQPTTSYNSGYIDNIVVDLIPTCPRPHNPEVTATTATSATLAWTPTGDETSWEIVYGTGNFDPDDATANIVTVTTNPFEVQNLSSATSYTFYVRALCSATDVSPWSQPASGATLCDGPVALPYSENFDAYPGTTYNTPGIAPACWTTYGTNPTYGAPHITSSGSYHYAHSGTNCMVFTCNSSGSMAYAALPDFNQPLNTLTLNFWRAMESTTQGELTVGYVTDLTDFDNSYVVVTTIPSVANPTGDTITVDFTSANVPANGNICFRWFKESTFYSCCIDDINVTSNGSAPVITNPTVATTAASNIGQNNATLNATITNPDNVTITAKGFEWKATTGGTYTQVTGTGTGNSFTADLSNLNPSTNYTYKAFITYNGTTTYGTEMNFTTLPQGVDPCNVPTGLHTTNIENHAITIAWDADANVESWNIQYRVANSGALSSATSTTNSYTITNLEGNTDYEIQVQANCGNGNLSDWSAAITAHTTNVGIENWLENSIVLFPNPAREYVDIRIDGDVNVTNMEVFDVYGKLINTVNVIDNPTRINVNGLADGMYFVRVTTDKGAVTKTFVKK